MDLNTTLLKTIAQLERSLSLAYMTLAKVNKSQLSWNDQLKKEIEHYDSLIEISFKISKRLKNDGEIYESKEARTLDNLAFELLDVVRRIKKRLGFISL